MNAIELIGTGVGGALLAFAGKLRPCYGQELQGHHSRRGHRCATRHIHIFLPPSIRNLHYFLSASIDYHTDNIIQKTIQTEFADRTLLCIAHRLRTIIGYDRILVMDAGQVAEYDTPEVLFAQAGGIFRGMCERSGIGMEDIVRAREGHGIDEIDRKD